MSKAIGMLRAIMWCHEESMRILEHNVRILRGLGNASSDGMTLEEGDMTLIGCDLSGHEFPIRCFSTDTFSTVQAKLQCAMGLRADEP